MIFFFFCESIRANQFDSLDRSDSRCESLGHLKLWYFLFSPVKRNGSGVGSRKPQVLVLWQPSGKGAGRLIVGHPETCVLPYVCVGTDNPSYSWDEDRENRMGVFGRGVLAIIDLSSNLTSQ